MNKKLDDAVKSYLPRLVQSVCESIRFPSIYAEDGSGFPYGLEIARAADHAMACARQLGFRVTDLNGRVSWAEFGEGEETVAVMGHLDVVPPGDGWEFDPFCGTVRGGAIYGRGSQDDKGPLFSALYALRAVADLEEPLSKRVRIIFGQDEESGRMRDVEAYLQSEPAPRYSFTPDGAYPVVNTEKGRVKFTVTRAFDAVDSHNLRLISVDGGESMGSVPAKAEVMFTGTSAKISAACSAISKFAILNNWEIKLSHDGDVCKLTVYGRAAHATLPELGVNAVGRMLVLLSKAGFEGEIGQFLLFLAEKIGTESDGKSLGIAAQHEHCGALTLNMATIKGDAQGISLSCGVYVPAETLPADEVRERLSSAFESVGAEFCIIENIPALFYSPEHPLIQTLQRGYYNATGKEPYLVSMCGGTYSKKMPNMVPYGATFEDEDDRAHAANEKVLISNLSESCRLMAYAILEMAK